MPVSGLWAGAFVEIHHLRHWRDGGTTDVWNLLSLCPFHHDGHHRGEFTITGGTCISGTVLKPGDSCTIIVQYVPPTTGLLTSTAHVTISDTGALTATQNSANFTAD